MVARNYFLYVLMAASVMVLWTVDRSAQYKAGVAACEAESERSIVERLPDILEKADKARKEEEKAKDEHIKNKEEIRIITVPSDCAFTDDELRIFNKAIEAANNRAPRSP